MSLATKGSRPIRVDDETYRWAVSPDSGYDVIVVQAAPGNGAKLLVTVDHTRLMSGTTQQNRLPAITPALVVTIIRQARQNGWQPGASGSNLAYRLNPDHTLEPRVT